MRNRFPGYCYYCKTLVPQGEGHFEKCQDAKGFRVIHAECVFKQRAEKSKALEASHDTQTKSQFAEYLGEDEQGNMRLRLGIKFAAIYVEKGKDIYKETAKGLVKVTLEELVSKPWIRENFERERAFQNKKAMAIRLQSAFERRYPPARKRAKGSLAWA